MNPAAPHPSTLWPASPPEAALRGLADLRGTAGRAARHRRVRRPLARAARRESRAERLLGQLEQRTATAARIEAEHVDARRDAHGHPPLPLQPPTIAALYTLMGACDTLLVASALQDAKPTLSPLMALVLASGIGVALVLLGRRLGHELTEFDRLRDQSARWGVIAALVVAVVAIASIGLTLLRALPPWSWPLLALAVPLGSAALTWLTDDPAQLRAARVERKLEHSRRAVARVDRRLIRDLAHTRRLRTNAEYRLRARLAPGIRRAILDGSLPGDDLGAHSAVVVGLVGDHLPPARTAELAGRRDRCTARLMPTVQRDAPARLFGREAA